MFLVEELLILITSTEVLVPDTACLLIYCM